MLIVVSAKEISGREVIGVDVSIPLSEYAIDSLIGEPIKSQVKFKKADVKKISLIYRKTFFKNFYFPLDK